MRRGESLRDELERRRATGGGFTLDEAITAVRPLLDEVATQHDDGARLFVHPGSIRFRRQGCTLDRDAAAEPPTLDADRACLPPDEADDPQGDPSASVFAFGAILYEMVTGASAGPEMEHPCAIDPALPEAFERLVSKALVTDAAHRPTDLRALAQALEACATGDASASSESDDALDVDFEVSMSLLPPASPEERRSLIDLHVGRAKAATPPAPASAPVPSRITKRTTEVLAELKARLESDTRPRYVVIKQGMDHGPFTAVELLHQIAVRNFSAEHALIDSLVDAKDERPIAEWPDFAPFAEQAGRVAQAQAERSQLAASVDADATRTRLKTFVAVGIGFVGVAALAGLYFRTKTRTQEAGAIRMGIAQNVDFEGGVARGKGPAGAPGSGSRTNGDEGDATSGGSGTSHPVITSAGSCEEAQAKYIEDYSKDAPPDLSAGAFGGRLNSGEYLNACGVPPSMAVNICAAIQNGRAVGVTVSTSPPNGGIARCISGQVRSMSFPSHPRLDVTRTTFAAQ